MSRLGRGQPQSTALLDFGTDETAGSDTRYGMAVVDGGGVAFSYNATTRSSGTALVNGGGTILVVSGGTTGNTVSTGTPVIAISLGGVDITNDGWSVSFRRGASFDGSGESPGTCVLTVRNHLGKYNPANGSSSIAAQLKIGKELRITATWQSAPFGLFHGFVRRIVPLPGITINDQMTEIHAEDALWKYGRGLTTVEPSLILSYRALREAIMADVGEPTTRLSLADGVESNIPLAVVDHSNALSSLERVNQATGSMHWVTPTATSTPGYLYRVLTRGELQINASVETFSEASLTTPYPVELGGYDYTDEGVVNLQRVIAHPFQPQPAGLLWTSVDTPFVLQLNQTRSTWVDLGLTLNVGLSATASPVGGLSSNVAVFASSALITLTGTAAGGTTVSALSVTGRLVDQVSATATSTDATSTAAYGTMAGSDLDSTLIAGTSEGQGLADWIVYRYKDPRAKPSMTLQNRFPTQLQREIGDRITLSSVLESTSAREYFIRSLATTISTDGFTWQTTYELEEAPATVSAFTVGGTAGQGVGGTGILIR